MLLLLLLRGCLLLLSACAHSSGLASTLGPCALSRRCLLACCLLSTCCLGTCLLILCFSLGPLPLS